MTFKGPFQPKLFYDSVLFVLEARCSACWTENRRASRLWENLQKR